MSDPLQILIVEDSEDDAILIQRALLRAGHEPVATRVESLQKLEAALDGRTWDAILADYRLPGFTAHEALAAVRARGIDVPFLVVSGSIGEETAAALMKAGAHDYVLKGNLARLGPALTREIRDAAQRHRARQADANMRDLEQQLRHAQKMEAVGRLAGGIAHDFNNLLTVITGHVAMLADDADPESASSEDLRQVLAAAERAQGLTRQLLAFSRQQVTQPKPMEVSAVVAGMEPMLRRLISEDVRLEVHAWPEPLTVVADRGQIEQVIMNLAVNGKDAMTEGGVLRMRVSPRQIDEDPTLGLAPGLYACIEVEDTGTGIPSEHLPHIFEPFFTTKEQGRGTGLGLSTVFGIVSQSGGRIGVETRPGLGTTFRVLLPTVELAETVEAEARPPGSSPLKAFPAVLLVEDEAAVRAIARRVLQREGYEVIEAASGAEALRLAGDAQQRIGLLLTDMVMPSMTGRELADLLRSDHPELPVLFMSGYTRDELLRRGVAEEGIGFIEKPFTPKALLQSVAEALATTNSVGE